MKALLLATVTAFGLATGSFAEPAKVYTFSTLKAPAPDTVRAKAEAWLKAADKLDVARFEAIWAQSDRPTLDRLVDSIAMGQPEAATILADARDPSMPAPKELPAVFKNVQFDTFFKSNLALVYARSLANKRVF